MPVVTGYALLEVRDQQAGPPTMGHSPALLLTRSLDHQPGGSRTPGLQDKAESGTRWRL